MDKLMNQIKEEYGKITYTYTAYHKMKDRNMFLNSFIKVMQIVLTALSTSGFIATIVTNQIVLSWLGAVGSAISLFLNIYTKDFRLLDDAIVYKKAADELWLLRQKYISLMIDFDKMKIEDIRHQRDELQTEMSVINTKYPGTTRYGYKKARIALINQEEQFFSESELDKMLPEVLRSH